MAETILGWAWLFSVLSLAAAALTSGGQNASAGLAFRLAASFAILAAHAAAAKAWPVCAGAALMALVGLVAVVGAGKKEATNGAKNEEGNGHRRDARPVRNRR